MPSFDINQSEIKKIPVFLIFNTLWPSQRGLCQGEGLGSLTDLGLGGDRSDVCSVAGDGQDIQLVINHQAVLARGQGQNEPEQAEKTQ